MRRRDFLTTTGGIGIASAVTLGTADPGHTAGAPATPGLVAKARELSLALPWPDDGKGFGDSARRLARRIEANTGGSLRIALEPGRAAGNQLSFGAERDYAGVHPGFAYFAGLPGVTGLDPFDLEAWLAFGGQHLWDDLAKQIGQKHVLAGHTGASPALWSARPIATPADVRGARIFVRGLAREVVRGLGAETVEIDAASPSAAIECGAVDAIEWGSARLAHAAGLTTRMRQALDIGLNGYGSALSLSIALPVWQSLTDVERNAIEAAAIAEYRLMLSEWRSEESLNRGILASRDRVVFRQPSSELADAVARVSQAVVAHLAGRDAATVRIATSYAAYQAAVARPHHVS